MTPAVLLGILVVYFSEKPRWDATNKLLIIIFHVVAASLFAALWCIFTLVNLTAWVWLVGKLRIAMAGFERSDGLCEAIKGKITN